MDSEWMEKSGELCVPEAATAAKLAAPASALDIADDADMQEVPLDAVVEVNEKASRSDTSPSPSYIKLASQNRLDAIDSHRAHSPSAAPSIYKAGVLERKKLGAVRQAWARHHYTLYNTGILEERAVHGRGESVRVAFDVLGARGGALPAPLYAKKSGTFRISGKPLL